MTPFTVLAALVACTPLAVASFLEGCADAPWDSQTDFWNVKFNTSTDDIPFSPSYHNTYVQIRNRQRREVVLHCTNDPPPDDVLNRDALLVKVPVKNVAALDGFSQNLIDVSLPKTYYE